MILQVNDAHHYTIQLLVGGDWNMTFIFPIQLGIIIQIDFHIFQRGGSTTNQIVSGHSGDDVWLDKDHIVSI